LRYPAVRTSEFGGSRGAAGKERRAELNRTVGQDQKQVNEEHETLRLTIGETVKTALRQNRLLFAFQPVVCATTGEIDYFECLLRMRDEEGNIVPSGEFIAMLEKVGLIGLIDRFVLEKTARELADHPALRLGFNVSGLTAGDRPWLRSLISLMAAGARRPSRRGNHRDRGTIRP
jgi:predicted signal transduction protein with EAL and GGDEF domain